MTNRNPHLANLQGSYLFPEIKKRVTTYLDKHPSKQLISLGIGDTALPITPTVINALKKAAEALGTESGYRGYGPSQGELSLRQKITSRIYSNKIDPESIYISDGAKCDIGRLQVLFGSNAIIGVQDPAYPVYVDTAVAMGQGNTINPHTGHYQRLCYLPCSPDNDFFPNPDLFPSFDVLYFCSPNNPTGAVASHTQLEHLVATAKRRNFFIVFDAAYSCYIQDSSLPRSIYEIEGADEVAIEINSFSKLAGFTGLRLGWTIVPEKLRYHDKFKVSSDWMRMVTTFFNGASNLIQAGGEAVLSDEGWKETEGLLQIYMNNAAILKKACSKIEKEVYGGKEAPYLWVNFKKPSWEVFENLLKVGLIATPGRGFGPAGEGFIRFSAFGKPFEIEKAAHKLQEFIELLDK